MQPTVILYNYTINYHCRPDSYYYCYFNMSRHCSCSFSRICITRILYTYGYIIIIIILCKIYNERSLFTDLAPRPTQNAGNPQRLPFPGSTHGYPARPPSVYASSTQQPSLAGKQPPFGATGPSVQNNKPTHKKSCK